MIPFSFPASTNDYHVHRYVRTKLKEDRLSAPAKWQRIEALDSDVCNNRESLWIKVPKRMNVPMTLPMEFHRDLTDYIIGEEYLVVAADILEGSNAQTLIDDKKVAFDPDCVFLTYNPKPLTPEELAARKEKEIRRRTLQKHYRKHWDLCVQCNDKADPRWKAEGFNIRYGMM